MFVGLITWGKAILKLLRVRRKIGINPQKLFDYVQLETLRENLPSYVMEERLSKVKHFRDRISNNAEYKARRIGRNADGGYVVPDLNYDKVVSIGIGKETSFEEDHSLSLASILMFDHTISKPPTLNENAVFYPLGVAESSGGNFLSFESILEIAQIDSSNVNLLKVDIEGNEYKSLEGKNFGQFAVVVIELHFLDKVFYSDQFPSFCALIENLTRQHLIFHSHANNWGKLFNFGNIVIPNVIEITLIRQDLLVKNSESVKNEKLDFPCKPGYMEIWPVG